MTDKLSIEGVSTAITDNAFVVNSRHISPSFLNAIVSDKFARNVAIPQLVYGTGDQRTDVNLVSNATDLTEVQGVFAFIVAERDNNPRYYDIHVHTCWGGSRLETTTRLTAPRLGL